MNKPNIANLRKRARAMGYVITKASDASLTGSCEYVLHRPEQDWENMEMTSLWGVQYAITTLEKSTA